MFLEGCTVRLNSGELVGGTYRGYGRHRTLGEEPCDSCRQANAAASSEQYERFKRQDPDFQSRRKRQQRFTRYGIDETEFQLMWAEQAGACAICETALTESSANIDHDHSCCEGRSSCGRCVRGLLCTDCNWGLGKFADDPDRLIAATKYLESARCLSRG